MRKLLIAMLSVALLASATSFAQESSVAGGFEASGHIFVGSGWQRFKTTATAPVAVTTDINGTTAGVIGQYTTAARVNKEDDFKFFLDEFEIDVAKTFGENIRVRADLDFGSQTLNGGPRFTNGNGAGSVGVLLEQAYITANIAVGNGLEFLVGRFNAPIGFESNDVIDNDTVSRSAIYRALRPHTFTGLKLYYAFSDLVDWHFWVANNGLAYDDGDAVTANTDIPSAGWRLGFNWGEEGKESTLGFAGAWGQDHANRKNGWSFLGDVDWNWWATDNFALGGEGIYRQINTITAGQKNGKYYGGLLNLHYEFSDVWDGTLRYSYVHDVNGATPAGALVLPVTGAAAQSLTGFDQQLHEVALAGNYTISDGAKLRLEGSYTMINPTGTTNNQHVFGFVTGFGYEF